VQAERERVRLWLHDRVLQLVEYVAAGGYAEAPDAEHLREVAALAAAELRGYVDGAPLRTPEALVPALLEVVGDAQVLSGPVPVRLVVGTVHGEVPAAVVSALAAATHEALANVRKHARASRATVRCGAAGGLAIVSIEDDGVGFDPAATPWGSGLRHSVAGRVAAVGGHVDVDTAPGAGTRVRLRVLLPDERGAAA